MMSKTLLLTLTVVLCHGMSVAQTTTAPPPKPRDYRVQAAYGSGVAQSYIITEKTNAKRTFEDGNEQSYQRDVKYYTTVRCIETSDGISTLVVNMDSLEYAFTADGATVEYDSQKDITPKNFADLNTYLGPLNRPYQITVSPYGAVSDVKGEQVDFWRDYLNENAPDLDSVTYMIWIQSLSDENLLHYGDLQKRVIPGLKVAIDSTWEHLYTVRLDGVQYSGRVTSHFDDYSGGYYRLSTVDTIQASNQLIHTYGLPVITTVYEGEAAIDHKVELSNGGSINSVELVAQSWFKAKALNVHFKQETTTVTNWSLTGQYQW
jgi:hypothetical protein